MKQKLFTLLTLLLVVCSSAWADDATFTISSIFTGSNTSQTLTEPVNATVSTNVSASNANQGKLGSDGNYFQLILTDDTFTGAVFNGYINTTATDKNWAFQFTTNGGTTWSTEVTQANDGTKSAHDISVGVTIPSGANGLRIIRRAGTTSYVFSIKLTLAVVGPSISASNVSIGADDTNGSISYTIVNPELDGAVTSAVDVTEGEKWLTSVTLDAGNSKANFVAPVNDTGANRTATIRLTYTYSSGTKSTTKDVTITQTKQLKGTELIKATITSNTEATVTGTAAGSASVSLAAADAGKTGYKFNGAGKYVGLTLADGFTFLTGDIINVHTTAVPDQGNIMFYDKATGGTLLQDTGEKGGEGDNKFVLGESINGRQSIYICRTGSDPYNWNGHITFISVSRPNSIITLNASGYTTYSKATDFEFVGAKAYKMTLNEETNAIAGTEVSGKIAAGEGILFKGEAGAPVAITETTGAVALEGNDLKGSTKDDGTLADKPTYCYVLSGNTFKNFTGAALTPNKAYFAATKNLSASGREFTITFDGEEGDVTGISEIKKMRDGENETLYNLAGQRVNASHKGIVIVNGKKVVIK